MAVEIELSGSGFDKTTWRKELGNFVFQENEWEISPLTIMFLDYDTPDLILYDDEPEREASHDAEVWVHPVGGIRGVTVKNSEQGIILSLPTGTGKRDWELAEAFAEAGRDCGATILLDHEAVPSGTLDFQPAYEELWSLFIQYSSQGASQSDDGTATLPILFNQLHIDLTTSDISHPDLHDQLVERMHRYSQAHWASDMVASQPGGRELTLNVAGGVPTLVKTASDGILLLNEPDSLAADVAPLFGDEHVPTEKFIRVMKDHVEPLGPVTYVPVFKYTDHPSILKALDPRPITPSGMPLPTAIANEQATQQGGHLAGPNSDDVLARGPVLVFLLIAAADGNVDNKETVTFLTILANSDTAPTPLFRKMLTTARDNFQDLFQDLVGGGKPATLHMVEFLQELDKHPESDTKSVKLGLYALGYEIANASGGFLGFGSKISKEERVALDGLRTLLGLDPSEVEM